MFAGKICISLSLYFSLSQLPDNFETFADNLELNLGAIANKNAYLIAILGDFNAKLSNWYKHDKTIYVRSKNETIPSQFGVKRLIQDPTPILSKLSSCIDLVFTSHSNLVME